VDRLNLAEACARIELPSGVRYELIERIGLGSAGAVYRAREVGAGFPREVCVKRLVVLGVETTRELREEARLLARLRHANVVSLLGMAEESSGVPFLVLELVAGKNLRALCRQAVAAGLAPKAAYLPDRVAIHIACALLRALGAVQRAIPGLVHRDVSPTNVLVSNEGEVKLGDFGIALARDRVRWTVPSLVKGKLGYMAPEQVRGDAIDPRADLFAVGVVLYELLARRRPWCATNRIDELRASSAGDIVPLATFRPDLDPALKNRVERLLAWSPHDRYSCADDALRALAPYSAGDLSSLRIAALVRELGGVTAREDDDEHATKTASRV
jgi:serine/threonine-protein kinase